MRSSSAKTIFDHIETTLERVVDDLFKELNTIAKSETPVKTGRAQKGWRYTRRYSMSYSGTLIENRVAYIGILDKRESIVHTAIRDSLFKRPRNI